MRLDRMLQALLPHGNHFYQLFEDSAANIHTASELLMKLPSSQPADRAGIIQQISQLEQDGDNLTHTIFAELHATFVTPFDREDIHLLASALDDILDNIDGSARRFHLYKIGNVPERMTKIMQVLHESTGEVARAMPLLRDFKDSNQLKSSIKRINECENQADIIFAEAVADLFENVQDTRDLIKLKEVYVSLETATDMCEDVANVMETLLIKHA